MSVKAALSIASDDVRAIARGMVAYGSAKTGTQPDRLPQVTICGLFALRNPVYFTQRGADYVISTTVRL